MKPEIISILPSGYGHWIVKVEQQYVKSKNVWEFTTNDSILIDEYKHNDSKKAKKQLIKIAKEYGIKTSIK